MEQNCSITDICKTPDSVVSSPGVKRKQNNKHYSPETVAKITKYATKHGTARAAKHFSNLLNVYLGESTVRGMKTANAQITV